MAAFLFAVACSSSLTAQRTTIIIRLFDGRNGKPVTGAHTEIRLIESYSLQTLQTDPSGDEYLATVPSDTAIGLGNVKISKDRWSDFKQCTRDDVAKPSISVQQIITTGVLAPNICSNTILAHARPGLIVFFIQPLSWSDKLKLWANGFKD